ncbi:MAG: hypothetical protein ACOH2M_03390 [Cypionkella sp.]
MAERLDVLLTREYQAGNETKTAFTKVGVAFATKNGGWSVKMEAMPAPVDGLFSFVLFPVKAKDDNGGGRQPSGGGSQSHQSGSSASDDDGIPF